MAEKSTEERFTRLCKIMEKLRDPDGGCPWDLEQTHISITPYLIEEAYEVIEAIEDQDDQSLRKELGDLLLQAVFHAQMAKERGAFSINEVIEAICEKLIRRHPHVFGNWEVTGADEVLSNWEAIKRKEREEDTGQPASALDGVPRAIPALIRAQRLGEKASKVKFDWDSSEGVWRKVEEELGELKEEIKGLNKIEDKTAFEHELGDVLFSLCQLSRWSGISAETALRKTCERFIERFQRMEKSEKDLSKLNSEQLDALWRGAKG